MEVIGPQNEQPNEPNQEIPINPQVDDQLAQQGGPPVIAPAAQQLDRYYVMNGNICIMNTAPDVVWFFWWITLIHWIIDKYHDQLAGGRGSDLKSKDTVYRQKGLINNIVKSSTGIDIQFEAGSTTSLKRYRTDSGVHTLQQAFERDGDDFYLQVSTGNYRAPSLPELHIIRWMNCASYQYTVDNKMVIYKQFDTVLPCTNTSAGNEVHSHAQINVGSDPNYGYVLDAGPAEVFNSIIKGDPANNPNEPLTGNGQSGKLDSSSSSGPVSPLLGDGSISEYHQSFVPFMNIYTAGVNPTLIGPVMLYSTILSMAEFITLRTIQPGLTMENSSPTNEHVVLLAFRLATFTPNADSPHGYNPAEMYSAQNMGGLLNGGTRYENALHVVSATEEWVHLVITTSVPELPSIAKYMAGNRGCFSYIKSLISGRKSNLCEQYKDVALSLFTKIKTRIGGVPTIFAQDPYYDESSDFVMAFLMAAKCDGDQKRGLDAFVLSQIGYSFTTGTIDGFLARFLCLVNLFVYCANKNGGNLTVNDVRNIDPVQMAAIQNRNAESKCKTLLNRFNHYNSILPIIPGPPPRPAIITDVIDRLIVEFRAVINEFIEVDGILNPNNLKLIIAARSGRNRTFMAITNSSNFYEYIPGSKIFSQDEMDSILKYYLVFVQIWIYLNLLRQLAPAHIVGAQDRIIALSRERDETLNCEDPNRQRTIDILTAFEITYGNLFKFLEKCFSIRYFISQRQQQPRTPNTIREIVNDFAKFFRMNICSESLNQLIEPIIEGVSLRIRPITESLFEPRVSETISSKTNALLSSAGITTVVFGGVKRSFSSLSATQQPNKKTQNRNINILESELIAFYRSNKFLSCALTANKLINEHLHSLNNNGIPYDIEIAILTEFDSTCKRLHLLNELRTGFSIRKNTTKYTNARKYIDREFAYYYLVFSRFRGILLDGGASVGIVNQTGVFNYLYNTTNMNPFDQVDGYLYQLILAYEKNYVNSLTSGYYPDYYEVPNEIVSDNNDHDPSRGYWNYAQFYSDYVPISVANKPTPIRVIKPKNTRKGLNFKTLHGYNKNSRRTRTRGGRFTRKIKKHNLIKTKKNKTKRKNI